MKKIITITLIFSVKLFFSQVAIGKQSISSLSVSLEFYDGADNKRGLVLPWVQNLNLVTFTSDSNIKKGGVMLLDTQNKKIKISKNDGTWRDLSVHTNELVTTGNVTIDTSLQDSPNYPELNSARVVVGGNPSTDDASGILVLADTNKAMILPKVASPHLNIIKPSAGMMAYDTVTKQLAVFNGTVWTFWAY
ncbi:MAG: hypothetical protein KBA33_09780 [Cloacibacterium sp.]|jgi:hypothetical protein|nr:hypothetical protein [Cloacibacterium sp.]